MNFNMRVGVDGWMDQVGIRITHLSIGLKVEAYLSNKYIGAGYNVVYDSCI